MGAADVNDAVDDDRRRRGTVRNGQLGRPGETQIVDVAGIHLVERRIVIAAEAAALQEPVLAGVHLREHAFLRDVALARRNKRHQYR